MNETKGSLLQGSILFKIYSSPPGWNQNKMKSQPAFFCLHHARISAIFFLAAIFLPISAFADPSSVERTSKLICMPAQSENSKSQINDPVFTESMAKFVTEMHNRHGFDQETLDCLFSQIQHNSTVIRLVKPFPSGKPKNWQTYRSRFIEPVRITAGAKFWEQHQKALERAEKEYGVPPEIVVGIIGIETTYGRNKGNFRIMDALATLAFDYPEHPKREARMALFRNELENTLLFSAEEGIDPLSIKGSYAGAIGWPQFLPSSVRTYAVDFDGDGKIDLRNSPVDAIGSVAHFLSEHGWKRGEPTVFPATLNADCRYSPKGALNQGLVAKLTKSDLQQICVSTKTVLPDNMLFGLIDLQNGYEPTEYWLGTNNFFAITHYNRSYFYAMAVITLGQSVKAYRNQNKNN